MDWQSILAIGMAVLCGVWAVWRFVQSFVPGRAGCSGCMADCRIRQAKGIDVASASRQLKANGKTVREQR